MKHLACIDDEKNHERPFERACVRPQIRNKVERYGLAHYVNIVVDRSQRERSITR